jgi:hypothetical protein
VLRPGRSFSVPPGSSRKRKRDHHGVSIFLLDSNQYSKATCTPRLANTTSHILTSEHTGARTSTRSILPAALASVLCGFELARVLSSPRFCFWFEQDAPSRHGISSCCNLRCDYRDALASAPHHFESHHLKSEVLCWTP